MEDEKLKQEIIKALKHEHPEVGVGILKEFKEKDFEQFKRVFISLEYKECEKEFNRMAKYVV